jgi:hypothetical protein
MATHAPKQAAPTKTKTMAASQPSITSLPPVGANATSHVDAVPAATHNANSAPATHSAPPQLSRSEHIQSLAGKATAGPSSRLPYLDQIQEAFGHHRVDQIKAHTGADATKHTKAMNATAFTKGDRMAFNGRPSLFTAAHESTHYLQQRHGRVDVPGNVGSVGDRFENMADKVASRVVAGKSAVDLLNQITGSRPPATSRAKDGPNV